MGIKATIRWDPQAQGYVVSSAYNDSFVNALKQFIPAGDRDYDPQSKQWYVKEAYGAAIHSIAVGAFGMHQVSFVSKQVAEQAQQARANYATAAPRGSLDDSIVQLITLMGYDSVKKAYRFAAAELHPDKPGGNAQKMGELNELWARVEKEFFKR